MHTPWSCVATWSLCTSIATVERARPHLEPSEVVGSYADLLADPEVDLVYNPLVNSLHAPLNKAALRAGKHVLTEKPSASNAEEAEEVLEIASGSPGRFVEGFHYLFHPVFERLVELVATGAIGEVRRTEVSLTMPEPDDSDPRWRFELAGGSVMDLGCYSLHASRMLGRFLGGEPSVTRAVAVERAADPGVDESMTVDLVFPNGVEGTAGSSMVGAAFDFHCRVIGTLGEVSAPAYVLPHTDDSVILTTPAGTVTEHLGMRSSYTYQLEAVAAHIREGAQIVPDAQDAVHNMRLIDAAYVAAGLPIRPRHGG